MQLSEYYKRHIAPYKGEVEGAIGRRGKGEESKGRGEGK